MIKQITSFINALLKGARVIFSIGLFAVLSAGALYAQNEGKISGTIKDQVTGEPLIGANIVVLGTSMGAASGVDGSYYILNITPGKYDLQVSMLGYQKIIQKNTIVNSGKTTIANFSMISSSLQLSTVVIQATRPDVEKEKTSTSTIIRTDDIQNMAGIRTVGDVIGLAADVTDGHFRGGRTGEEYYTLQGMGIINPLNSTSAFLPIMSAVEEVEVVTSGFGAEYGNAQSGVVNITMKEGKSDKWRATADVRTRAPGRKHFGPSVFDPKSNPGLSLLNDSLSAWLSSDPSSNNQGYFRAFGLNNIFGGDTAAQLAAARTLWRYQTKRDMNRNYGTEMDQSAEFTLGGPVNEKMRMFLAFRNDINWPTFPTEQPDKQRQIMGNLVFDVSDGASLRLSGGYALDNTNVFPSQNSLGFYNWMWDRILSINYQKNENIQLGLRFSKALDKSTFYDIKLNSLITNNTVGSAPAPSSVADSLIYPKPIIDWDKVLVGATTSPDLFYYLKGDDNFKNEKTRTYSLDASMTSQVTKSHLLNGGIQFNAYTIDVNDAASTQTGSGGAISVYSAHPYEGALYIQDKMEFEGMIANVGLRLDVWNSGLNYYTNLFAPYKLIMDSIGVRYDAASASQAKSPIIARLQPRVGVSFPVGEFTVFHANYGSFMQRPSFQYVVGATVQQGSNMPQILGNPRLEPQITNSYDVGIMQGLVAGFTLDISGYYKDVKNLVEAANFTSNKGLTYTSYYNRDNADIRGFRVALAKKSGFVSGSINYQYSVATGKSATADYAPPSFIQDLDGNVTTNNDKVPLKDVLLGFDRTHNLTVNLVFDSDELLRSLGSDLNLGTYLSLNMFARSGLPYTSPSNPKLINGSRTPAEYNTNLRLTKRLTNFWGIQAVNIYFEVFNLFNNKILNYDYIFATPNALAVSTVTQLYEQNGIDGIKYWNANPNYIPKFSVDQSFLIYSNQPRSFNLGVSLEL
ncbi:MAG: TonB-dependent receptor [Ignavibacteriaceae bacterium]|nr:TonB-dependent receptor [Ignavibacteriaceae bacterium]